MSPVKAYLLGLAWADGFIHSNQNRFAFSSKEEELAQISFLFYPKGRPLETRKGGVYVLHVYCKKIVQELISLGFTPRKSCHGQPVIPVGYEKYFLLGLLDGDGCIYIERKDSEHPQLRVSYSGNRETMELIQSTITTQTGVIFPLRHYPSAKERFINNVKINDHHLCVALVLACNNQAVKYLEWLYDVVEDIPYFRRKFNVYQTFLATWNTIVICPLCANRITRSSSTVRYCIDCRVLLRRLRNRQQDHLNRKSVRLPLTLLLSEEEKQRINIVSLEAISSSGGKRKGWSTHT